MHKLFGVSSNSLLNVYATLAGRYGKRYVAILSHDLTKQADDRYHRRLRRAKIMLAGSVRDMLANIQRLNKSRAPLLVFDNPIVLRNYPIKLLDGDQQTELLRRFRPQPLDFATLLEAVDNPTRQKHQLQRNVVDVLPQIIQEHTVSGFMDKFNSFMYSITNAGNRIEIRNIIVRFVFGKIDEGQFYRQLQERGVRLNKKSEPYYREIVDYLHSAKGATLRQALAEALKMETQAETNSSKRTIKYKQICEKYSVDRFDLRNLILLYRDMK